MCSSFGRGFSNWLFQVVARSESEKVGLAEPLKGGIGRPELNICDRVSKWFASVPNKRTKVKWVPSSNTAALFLQVDVFRSHLSKGKTEDVTKHGSSSFVSPRFASQHVRNA